MFGLNSYVLIGAVASLALVGTGAYLVGDSAGANRVIARDAKAMQKAIGAINNGRVAIDTLSGRVAEAQVGQQSVIREIYHDATTILQRPVYRSACIDSDGVRLLDRATAAANAGLAGEPANETGADR